MIVGEERCSCSSGYRIFAVMPDGSEHVTDAPSLSAADVDAWATSVVARSKAAAAGDKPAMDRITAMRVSAVISFARLTRRQCTDCEGRGWLFRLHREDAGLVG